MATKKSKTLTVKSKKVDAKNYASFFEQIKSKVRQAQVKASLAVNSELIKLYWDIGKSIVEKQEEEGWGASVIEKLCEDLQNSFPGIQGFSRSNIFRMRAFYQAYEIVAQAARQFEELPLFKIPWFHNVILVQKLKSSDERLWYAQQVIENGLSRNALEDWIKSKAYKRHGKAITNFKDRLPEPQSKLAQEILKDPYNFDFLTLESEYREAELEQGLIDHIQKLLLELGKGFAFIGSQYHLEIAGEDYYVDLLFYHIKLKCFVVVELKARKFDPKDAGQLNFYLSAIDDLLRTADDKPTIGILLCKTKNNFVAEYALRGINKPIGVAEYETTLLEKLPKELKSSLPTIQEIEEKLDQSVLKRKKSKSKKH